MTAQQEIPPHLVDQNKGPAILAICSTLTVVATCFVAARLYVRAKILSRVGLDDWLILVSMLCGYLMLGLTIAAVRSGNGRHFATLSVEQKSGAILYTIAGFCPGILSFGIPKLAVVALLTKITNPSRAHRIFLWLMTSGCLLILFGCVIILFSQCTPARSQWDFSVKGVCWDRWILVYYAIVAGNISAAVDLYLAVYPAVVLYNLQINMKKKLALSVALGLGSIATAVAIYKSTRLPALASPDFSYDTSDITIWTSIEGNSIIIAACIPTLQPLFDLLLGRRVLGSTGEQYYKGYGSRSGMKTPNHIELSSNSENKSASRHRKMGVHDVTIAKDSQESILGSENEQGGNGNTTSEQKPRGSHWIQRTQDVTISYEDQVVEEPTVGERRGV
ncbi:hypothetical protein BDV95DRAFT_591327 [Massariosphaeria phaeospora]|uniref:Rhodopsin domain-containing protein n=1 Tax=Massariosphaeria phaeospora TaxID=100035 RepID=A0A7C8MVB6_9PLEO|nr:hypothetical protein BDV95DRAFT_591327 [Massariosphaeria phaeospora]